MKKYLYTLALVAGFMGLTSCDGTQEEPKIQWYPVVTLEGDTECYVEIGEDWTLPGYSAINTMTEEDVTDLVDVYILDVINKKYVDEIDTSAVGMFQVYYDSYGSVVETYPTVQKVRTVYVYDPSVTTDIEGTWYVNADESWRIRYAGTNAGQELTFQEVADANDNNIKSGIPVNFEKLVPGFYYVDDIEAGLVTMLYGYAEAYPTMNFQMHAYVSLNTDNTLTLLSTTFGYSGWASNYAVSDFEGSYDQESNTINYRVNIPKQGFYLDVVLEQL